MKALRVRVEKGRITGEAPAGLRRNRLSAIDGAIIAGPNLAVAFVISEDGPVTCALGVSGQTTVWPVQLLET
jgi:hypothetical protein